MFGSLWLCRSGFWMKKYYGGAKHYFVEPVPQLTALPPLPVHDPEFAPAPFALQTADATMPWLSQFPPVAIDPSVLQAPFAFAPVLVQGVTTGATTPLPVAQAPTPSFRSPSRTTRGGE